MNRKSDSSKKEVIGGNMGSEESFRNIDMGLNGNR